jgi:transposase
VVGSLIPAHHPQLLQVPRSQFRALEGIERTSAYRTTHEVYDRERAVVVSRSQDFEDKQARSFAQTLHKARRELRELKGVMERGRHRMNERALKERIDGILGRRWLAEVVRVDFDLERRRLSFRTDRRAAPRQGARVGQARAEWSDEEIVRAYRAQAEAEQAFRLMKDPAFGSFSPAFHWTDQKLTVHAFYCSWRYSSCS